MKSLSQLALRGLVLFFVGLTFALILILLQLKRQWPHIQSSELTYEIMRANWCIPVSCGIGSVIVGLLYPILGDNEEPQVREWSKVLRCAAMFIGINEAYIKIDFPSNWQLTLSLAILSIGLWWYFDRTPAGLGLGVSIAVITFIVAKLLFYNQVYIYSEKEFSYVKSWLPCVVFSGGITIGSIGKQLAIDDTVEKSAKKHIE